ncbi:MAG TPA: hypothetical protein VLZ75_03400 [Chitinophagales bacterium]|nr:hypothetical protein [Chitinophagales bacterium]
MEPTHMETLGQTLFYYQLYHPKLHLYVELPTNDLGVYENEVFASLIEGKIEKEEYLEYTYIEAPKIKSLIFLDALYQASKGMEPFLSISTRLFKLIVDEFQDRAVERDLDLNLYNIIKTTYWNILQEDASETLINKGFETVVQDAMKICIKNLLKEVLRQ